MSRYGDVGTFDARAAGYETGWRGDLHHRIADRTAEIATLTAPAPLRILDVGCGTGFLLRRLADDYPNALQLVGIDPAPRMIAEARRSTAGLPRLTFLTGVAERLPLADGTFDLIVSSTSFDHWADQRAGLAELARVMTPVGHLVITDLFSALRLPTLLASHRGRARTVGRASAVLRGARLQIDQMAQSQRYSAAGGMAHPIRYGYRVKHLSPWIGFDIATHSRGARPR
ncbi:MAG: class I SAM-dependent methyltransferase [Candidatus Dormibacteria bacterium]